MRSAFQVVQAGRPRRQVVRDGHQEHQAQSLAGADAGRQLEQQVFVVQVAARGGLGQAGGSCRRRSRARRRRRRASRGARRRPSRTRGRARAAAPRGRASRGGAAAARRARPSGSPLSVHSCRRAQREKAVAVEGEVVGAGRAAAAPDGRQLRQIAHEQPGDVEEVPGAPVGRAQQQPELIEGRLVPLGSAGRARRPRPGARRQAAPGRPGWRRAGRGSGRVRGAAAVGDQLAAAQRQARPRAVDRRGSGASAPSRLKATQRAWRYSSARKRAGVARAECRRQAFLEAR